VKRVSPAASTDVFERPYRIITISDFFRQGTKHVFSLTRSI